MGTNRPVVSVQETFLKSGSANLLNRERKLAGDMMNAASRIQTSGAAKLSAHYLPRRSLKTFSIEERVYDIHKKGLDGEQDARLEALALDISRRGIQEPLVVVKMELGSADDDDAYEILSGHRRCAAYDIAVAKYGYDPNGTGLPCFVQAMPVQERAYESKEALILNNLQRDKSDYERMMEIAVLRECVEERQRNGEDIPNVRTYIKDTLGVSDTEITRFDKIYKSLYYEMLQDFREGRIASTVAYEIAKQSEECQKCISDGWNREQFPVLQTAMVNELSAKFIESDTPPVSGEPSSEKKPAARKDKIAVPVPKSIDEGMTMLGTAVESVRASATKAFSGNVDDKTEKALLKKISKQMELLLSLQAELDTLVAQSSEGFADV